jgi:hypothetical protein
VKNTLHTRKYYTKVWLKKRGENGICKWIWKGYNWGVKKGYKDIRTQGLKNPRTQEYRAAKGRKAGI